MPNHTSIWTRRNVLTATAAAASFGWGHPLWAAAALPMPAGDPLFTVGGSIKVHNQGDLAVFDLKGLDSLPQTSFTTRTPWTPEAKFEGVLLNTLLDRLGGHGKTAVCYALNDYIVEIPLENLTDDGPLLATRMDGVPMPVQKFGPLFMVYRFDAHPEWRNNAMYARCIWQLQKMVVR